MRHLCLLDGTAGLRSLWTTRYRFKPHGQGQMCLPKLRLAKYGEASKFSMHKLAKMACSQIIVQKAEHRSAFSVFPALFMLFSFDLSPLQKEYPGNGSLGRLRRILFYNPNRESNDATSLLLLEDTDEPAFHSAADLALASLRSKRSHRRA